MLDKTNSGTVFEISRFRTDDGPGIRTAVFLKGCPLRCVWCHNPESQLTQPELCFDGRQCTGCGLCAGACPQHCHAFHGGVHTYARERCAACGRCAGVCRFGALRMIGKKMTPQQVMDEVQRDRTFYESSGGGLTLTGGEPLLQPEFSLALLKAAHREGVNTCVETCGFAPWETLYSIARETDIFLYDCKAADAERHRDCTGVDNRLILQNLSALDEMGCRLVLRLPVIPGCNDGEEDLAGIARIANGLRHIECLQIMPYHPLGLEKNRMLGKELLYTNAALPERERIKQWLDILEKYASPPVICAAD